MRSKPLTAGEMSDFNTYLRKISDAQIEGVLAKELALGHDQEVAAARAELRRRRGQG